MEDRRPVPVRDLRRAGRLIAPEPFDAPDSEALRAEHAAELVERYGFDSEPGSKPTTDDIAVFLVARDADGAAVACGALRVVDPDTVEIKRMFVRRAVRGTGLGRGILAALEAEAAALGAARVVLETGDKQQEAIGLYENAGYRPIPCFGAYAGSAISLCYGREVQRTGSSSIP